MTSDGTHSEDVELVRRSRKGEASAFDGLFVRYYDKVRSHAYRMVLDEHLADDIAQESFIRAASNLFTLREGHAFAAWIFRISGNIAKDKIRSRNAYAARLNAYAENSSDGNNISHDGDDLLERVRVALRRLPVKQREAVSLVWLEGKSHTEAATIIGCTTPTVSWRICIAKRNLKKFLT
jgi:RNA polymerase sigma-70 factor, ECF subfamily